MELQQTIVMILLTLFGITIGDNTVIEIHNGKIRGRVLKSYKNNDFYAFESIPYAAPPVGRNRFKVPTKHQNWKGILNTTKNNSRCTEFVDGKFIGSEDCLHLNVYTPADIFNIKQSYLPVMIYIHGGAYQSCIPVYYAPNYFMDYGVILVVINFRLGPFGFLTTGDGVIPGNLGLKDQRFAIKWVSENIYKFGGDPKKITLFGQSAGAMAIGFHLQLKQNKGLFRGAIMQSGSLLCHHNFEPDVVKYSHQLGKRLNSSFNGDSKELLTILMQLSTEQIATAAMEITMSLRKRINPVSIKTLVNVWLPTIENADEPDAIVTSPMHQNCIDGNYLKIPLMIGINSEETLSVYKNSWSTLNQTAIVADKHPEYLIRKKLNIDDPINAGKEIKAIYTDSFTKHNAALLQFMSDDYYTTPTLRLADLVHKDTPVYLYQFSYAAGYPVIPEANNTGHSTELKYLFGNQHFLNKNDRIIHKRLMKMWTNFAKYENPTPGCNELLKKWPQMTDEFQYMNINITLTILKNPRKYNQVKSVLLKYIKNPLSIF